MAERISHEKIDFLRKVYQDAGFLLDDNAYRARVGNRIRADKLAKKLLVVLSAENPKLPTLVVPDPARKIKGGIPILLEDPTLEEHVVRRRGMSIYTYSERKGGVRVLSPRSIGGTWTLGAMAVAQNRDGRTYIDKLSLNRFPDKAVSFRDGRSSEYPVPLPASEEAMAFVGMVDDYIEQLPIPEES